MGFRYELRYPSGEPELSDDVYETEARARSYAEDDVNSYAIGCEVPEDASRDYDEGTLEYIIIEE